MLVTITDKVKFDASDKSLGIGKAGYEASDNVYARTMSACHLLVQDHPHDVVHLTSIKSLYLGCIAL